MAEGMQAIPVIDLSKDEESVVKELMNALETIGFATLVNHGVPAKVIESVFRASSDFFQLDEATKLEYKYQDQSSNRGYIRCGAEHHDDHLLETEKKQSDCKETMDIGWDQEEEYQNMWPHNGHGDFDSTNFKTTMIQYFDTMDSLQLRLMRYIGVGLQLPDPDYLVERCNAHHENLRLLHYPALSATRGSIRGNAHTDFGTLTLLVQDQVGGLKVQRTDGTWINVKPTPNAIIVNVGDMLMRWTNDRLKATLHKVETPPNDADNGDTSERVSYPERFSIAFFCNANKDVELECLEECCSTELPARYPPINAHKYITQRLLDTINS